MRTGGNSHITGQSKKLQGAARPNRISIGLYQRPVEQLNFISVLVDGNKFTLYFIPLSRE